jgi:hypothetical protein
VVSARKRAERHHGLPAPAAARGFSGFRARLEKLMTITASQNRGAAAGTLKREVAIIPGWAYVLAGIVLIATPILFSRFIGPYGPLPYRILFPLLPATFFAFYVLMIGYVNRDAKRRGMNRLAWTLIVIFVPNAIGFIIYFLLRGPIQTPCPKCGAVIDARVNYCPHCRYGFHPTCPQCRTAVGPADTFCGHCGAKLEPQV